MPAHATAGGIQGLPVTRYDVQCPFFAWVTAEPDSPCAPLNIVCSYPTVAPSDLLLMTRVAQHLVFASIYSQVQPVQTI